MGLGRDGAMPPPSGFSHMISLMCFSTRIHLAEASKFAPTICAGWCFKRQEWLRPSEDLGTKLFSHESGLNFLKKVGIFLEMDIFLKRSLIFMRGSWCSVFLGWAMGPAKCALYAPLIKWRRHFGAISSSWVFLSALPWKFCCHALLTYHNHLSSKFIKIYAL